MSSYELSHPVSPPAPAEAAPQAPPVINMRDIPLGTLIYRSGLLTAEQLESALAEGSQTGKRLGEVLVERGWLEEADVARLLAGQKGLPFVDLRTADIDQAALRLVPPGASHQYRALAIAFEDGLPVVAIADPANETALAFLQERFGDQFKLAVASRSAIDQVLRANVPTQIASPPAGQPAPAPAPAPPPVVAAPPEAELIADDPAPSLPASPVPAPSPPPAPATPAPTPAPVAYEPPAPAPQPVVEGPQAVFRVVLRLTNGEQVELFESHDEVVANDAARDVVRRLITDEASGWPHVSGRFVRPGAIVSIDVVSSRA